MNIIDRLRNVISVVDDMIDTKEINSTTNLVNDYGFDSIKIIQMVMEIEEEFDIDIEQDDLILDNLAEIAKLLELINRRSAEQ